MPFKKGQSGNPGGRPSDKMFGDAIRSMVNEEDPSRRKRKLRCLVDRLYEDAMNGEGWAMCQIADRIDGKPAQETALTVRNELDGLDDRELRAFIRRETAEISRAGEDTPQPPGPRVVN